MKAGLDCQGKRRDGELSVTAPPKNHRRSADEAGHGLLMRSLLAVSRTRMRATFSTIGCSKNNSHDCRFFFGSIAGVSVTPRRKPMKKNLSLAFAMLAVAATSAVCAQTPTPATNTGLLGQRFGEISAGAFDPHGGSDLGFAGALSANVPVRPGLDVG